MWVMDWGMTPGVNAELSTQENFAAFGRRELTIIWGSNPIDGAARDAGSSPTFELRAGLLLGLVTATKKFKQYDPAATDGSQVARGFLGQMYRMVDVTNVNQDKLVPIIIGGPVKAGLLFGLDAMARAQMFGRFVFDDDYIGVRNPWVYMVTSTGDTTVTAAQNGTQFITGGGASVTYTLPTLAVGLRYRFTNVQGFNMVVTGAVANKLVTFNNATATSVAYSTGGQLIGGSFELVANTDASKWLVFPYGSNTVTVA